MKNFLGLIPALIFLGACSSTPNSKRTPSSTPQTVLTIPVSDVKAIVLADTAASTNCIKVTSVQPTSDPFTSIYSTHDQFNCSTIVPMAVSIDNKALNVDKTFESFHSHTLQAIPSEKDLTSGEALEKLHKENVALITDHYKDLKAGCMGANVVVTIKGNEVNLESANHLGKARCAAVKAFNAARNAKNKA